MAFDQKFLLWIEIHIKPHNKHYGETFLYQTHLKIDRGAGKEGQKSAQGERLYFHAFLFALGASREHIL